MRLWLALLFAGAMVFAVVIGKPAQGERRGDDEDDDGPPEDPSKMYIVVLKKDAEEGEAVGVNAVGMETARRHVREKCKKGRMRGEFAIGKMKALLVEDDDEEEIEELKNLPEVESVEPNMEAEIDYDCVPQKVNSDKWALGRIARRGSLSGSWPLSYKYEDVPDHTVTIYILDTGVKPDHSEFGNRVIDGYTAPNCYKADKEAGKDPDTDNHGHGTHVAGIAAGELYGVDKHAQIASIKVMKYDGRGWISDIIKGIEHITQRQQKKRHRAVANASIGSGVSKALNAAVQALLDEGVSFVTAAGNNGYDACRRSPASMGGGNSSCITVGATKSDDSVASYSNFGSCVDVFAPGSSIKAASYRDASSYTYKSGTSMASPVVAGIVARELGHSSKDKPSTMKNRISRRATEDALTFPSSAAASDSPNKLAYARC